MRVLPMKGATIRESLVSLALLFVCTTTAYAGSASGQVTQIGGNMWGLFFVKLETRTDAPSCATNSAFAINMETASGRAMAAIAMSAHSQGHSVHIEGLGNCDFQGDMETPNFIMYQSQ